MGVYALILHRLAYSKQDWVTLPIYALKEWGLTADIRADALKRLEQAGNHRPFPTKGRSSQSAVEQEIEEGEEQMSRKTSVEARVDRDGPLDVRLIRELKG